jgi:predicted ester cyclase
MSKQKKGERRRSSAKLKVATVEATVDAVRRLFVEAFGGNRPDVADEVLTDDFRFQYPFPGFQPGKEGIKQFTRAFHTAFPGFELDVNDLFGAAGQDDVARVAIRWTLRGTHKGEFFGIGPTAKYASVSAIGIYKGGGGRDVSGKLREGWLEMDTLGLLQHVNAVPHLSQVLPGLRSQ